ncbi:UNKNOWN [Stylonychia lemnae]|uniref:EH domain-containing protein n=1 Tax=Stylonychia lemnae TaxID=5949 RepID=A0A078B7D9_STYLE|nr:UNKNOWN [Stylonychia lemnae]|eukprot:CDW90131.1 UNKNOWN [Stylonychia lemnae]
MLYNQARQGGLIEGKKAVDIFKLANVSQTILREIWNLSSVHKTPHLAKDEFFIFMRYLALAQQGYSVTIESMRMNNQKVDGPRFQGIQMPPPLLQKKESFNPFEDGDNGDDEGFEDFQEAKSTNSSKVTSQTSQSNKIPTSHLITNQAQNMHQLQNPSQNITSQSTTQSVGIMDLLDLNFKSAVFSMGNNTMVSQPPLQQQLTTQITQNQFMNNNFQSTSTQNQNYQPITSNLLDLLDITPPPIIQEIEQPKLHEDLIFEQMKNIKFQPQQKTVPSNIIKQDFQEQKSDDEDGWDNFQDSNKEHEKATSLIEGIQVPKLNQNSESLNPKNRIDLIRDAFADILDEKISESTLQFNKEQISQQPKQTTQQTHSTQLITDFQSNNLKINELNLIQNDEVDEGFDEFEQAEPQISITLVNSKIQKQDDGLLKIDDELLGIEDTPPTIAQKIQQPAFINDLLSLYSAPSPAVTQTQSQIPNQNLLTVFPQPTKSKNIFQNNDNSVRFEEGEVLKFDNKNEEDEENFDEFQGAEGQVSSIPDISDSRQDSNIFSNSRQDIDNENSFTENSQDYGDQKNKDGKFKPDSNWLQQLAQQTNNEINNDFHQNNNNQFDQEPKISEENDDDEGFGDWTDSNQNNQNAQDDNRRDNQNQIQMVNQNITNNNILELDDDDDSGNKSNKHDELQVEVIEVQEEPPKPKIELNENNLLSGFMMEFGKSLVNKHAPELQQQAEKQKQLKDQLNDLDFQVEKKATDQHTKIKTTLFNYENKYEMKESILSRINKYYLGNSQSESSIDYQNMSDQQIDALLNDQSQLNTLQSYLIKQLEQSEQEVKSKFSNHLQIIAKMDRKNKKKIKAATDEDFELAAKYRNQYNQLKNQLLQVKNIREMLNHKPILTEKQLFELVVNCDEKFHFSQNLFKNHCSKKLEKSDICIYLMQVYNQQISYSYSTYLTQINKGMSKLKQETDEIISAIKIELNQIQRVVDQVEGLQDQNENDSISELTENTRFIRFFKGILVFRRIVRMQRFKLVVAEMQEDDDYLMDIEALKQDSQILEEDLNQKISSLSSLNQTLKRILETDMRYELSKVKDLNELLKSMKDKELRLSQISDNTCNLCCHSFEILNLDDNFIYNSKHYHPFCINFWLNKVTNKTL